MVARRAVLTGKVHKVVEQPVKGTQEDPGSQSLATLQAVVQTPHVQCFDTDLAQSRSVEHVARHAPLGPPRQRLAVLPTKHSSSSWQSTAQTPPLHHSASMHWVEDLQPGKHTPSHVPSKVQPEQKSLLGQSACRAQVRVQYVPVSRTIAATGRGSPEVAALGPGGSRPFFATTTVWLSTPSRNVLFDWRGLVPRDAKIGFVPSAEASASSRPIGSVCVRT